MWKKIIQNFLSKNGYVDLNYMQEYILKIKEDAMTTREEELKMDFEHERNRIKQEHFLELEEKNAEIRHLGNIIIDLKQRVKDAEKVYMTSVQGIKKNLRISTEIGYQVKKLMETSATVYAAFENIQQQAEDHKKDMIENEKSNRSLLRIEK
ncbi:MAG TPA: hypothetical protein P5136_00575 [Methanofastidiosum sp.]|nr:hypothetical protein [Methanofastidiosum sp.]